MIHFIELRDIEDTVKRKWVLHFNHVVNSVNPSSRSVEYTSRCMST